MFDILLVSLRADVLSPFVRAMTDDPEISLETTPSGRAALERTGQIPPDLVVIDQGLPDMDPLELAIKIVTLNPMVNMAVASPLSDEEFHEASEGLGILAKLRPTPTQRDGDNLRALLKQVSGPLFAAGGPGKPSP